jgi:hypothetical protein
MDIQVVINNLHDNAFMVTEGENCPVEYAIMLKKLEVAIKQCKEIVNQSVLNELSKHKSLRTENALISEMQSVSYTYNKEFEPYRKLLEKQKNLENLMKNASENILEYVSEEGEVFSVPAAKKSVTQTYKITLNK